MNSSVTFKWDMAGVRRVESDFMKGLYKMAFNGIAPAARRNAPYKTGALRNSIRVTEESKAVCVLAGGIAPNGSNVPYGLIHELGGWTGRGHRTHITAKHYLGNALEDTMRGDFSKYWRSL